MTTFVDQTFETVQAMYAWIQDPDAQRAFALKYPRSRYHVELDEDTRQITVTDNAPPAAPAVTTPEGE